jgi:hypothetical protein
MAELGKNVLPRLVILYCTPALPLPAPEAEGLVLFSKLDIKDGYSA